MTAAPVFDMKKLQGPQLTISCDSLCGKGRRMYFASGFLQLACLCFASGGFQRQRAILCCHPADRNSSIVSSKKWPRNRKKMRIRDPRLMLYTSGWLDGLSQKDAISLGMYPCFLQVASDDGAFDRLDVTIDSSTRTPTTFRTGSSDTFGTPGLLMTKVMGFHFPLFLVFFYSPEFFHGLPVYLLVCSKLMMATASSLAC